ncbi:DTW domain-containing protein 2, partial [Clarias magur]
MSECAPCAVRDAHSRAPGAVSAQDEDPGGFALLSELPVEVSERRPTCVRCCRPVKVCLCPFLPAEPLDVSTCLYIVQHPAEESRVLRTVPLLAACLPKNKCKVLIGRRFSEEKHIELATVCRDTHTLVLYPGSDAENLEDMDMDFTATPHNVIIIDGTWSQAKDMFLRNALFHLPKQVQLNSAPSSQYVIRTQPTNMCLSTLECAAVTLSIMEKNPAILE